MCFTSTHCNKNYKFQIYNIFILKEIYFQQLNLVNSPKRRKLKTNKNVGYVKNSLHLAQKYINKILHLERIYARIFVRRHCLLFREANSFPRATLGENCELSGTDNVQGQISKQIKWRLLCLLSLKSFPNRQDLKIGGYHSDTPQGNIQSRDSFRPITRKRKYLLDYKLGYFPADFYCFAENRTVFRE